MPLILAAEGLDRILLDRLHLPQTEARMDDWSDLVERIRHPTDEVTIHFVGKYVEYEDSYKSLNEALYHGGFRTGCGSTSSGSRPRRSNRRAASSCSTTPTASSCPAVSATAAAGA